MNDYYDREDINEFLADMQAQFDSMVADLRDQVEALKSELEALRFTDHSHYTSGPGWTEQTRFPVKGEVSPPTPTLFEHLQDAHLVEE